MNNADLSFACYGASNQAEKITEQIEAVLAKDKREDDTARFAIKVSVRQYKDIEPIPKLKAQGRPSEYA